MRNPLKYISGVLLFILSGFFIGWITGNRIGPGLAVNTLIVLIISEFTDLFKDKYPFDRITYFASPYIKSLSIHLLITAAIPIIGIFPNGAISASAAVIFISYTAQFMVFLLLDRRKKADNNIQFTDAIYNTYKDIIVTLPPLDKLTAGIDDAAKKILPELLKKKMIHFDDEITCEPTDKSYLFYEDSLNSKDRLLDIRLENLREKIRDYGVLIVKYIPGAKAKLKEEKSFIIPRAELWGRLHYCGFEIIGEVSKRRITLLAAVKVSMPLTRPLPSKNIIIYLDRIGYRGHSFKAIKFRSMYPYSEFIQRKVFEINNFGPAGKLNNDFRITPIGKVLRKYWIDELPQIINWLKSDIKLVGIRGMSRHYFSLYPEDYRNLFIKVKPGLIPPIYGELECGSFQHIIDTEREYLENYLKKPFRTDLHYLFDTLYKIFFKGFRSS